MSWFFLILGLLYFVYLWFGFLDHEHKSLTALNANNLRKRFNALPQKSQFYVQGTWKLEQEVWDTIVLTSNLEITYS